MKLRRTKTVPFLGHPVDKSGSGAGRRERWCKLNGNAEQRNKDTPCIFRNLHATTKAQLPSCVHR